MGSSKLLAVLLLCAVVVYVQGNKDTTYTAKEKEALVKFREAVKGVTYLDYQKEDVYLIRWLRAKNLDIAKAKEMLVKSLQWRKANKIDSITGDQEMIKLKKTLPAGTVAVDREGRPVFQASFGSFDLRRYYVAGNGDLLSRYIYFHYEVTQAKIRDSIKAGKDVSQWIFLVDMNNYSARQHACLACVPFYLTLINTYEAHYPQTASHIIIINTPRIFEAILQLIRPLMSEDTRSKFQVLGVSREEWLPVLHKIISPSELTPQFGGTRETSVFN